ncbi:MAG: hypothetical protein HYY49_08650 [Ignavibacteriales bacterium]|nr:hypothetical protein [Ignavibacteriales bacterium]
MGLRGRSFGYDLETMKKYFGIASKKSLKRLVAMENQSNSTNPILSPLFG